MCGNVSDQPRYEAWLDEVVKGENGRFDILINNAAYVQWADVVDMSTEQALHTMRVRYDGMVIGVKRALPVMLAAGGGQL